MYVARELWLSLPPNLQWLALALGFKPEPVHTRAARAKLGITR